MDRRQFVSHGSAALTGASLGSIEAVRQWFHANLSTAPGCPAPQRGDYTLASGVTYFNHGSIGTTPRLVQEAHAKYLSVCESNPWLYMWGGAWEEARATTRKRAASFLGCAADEVVINRSTTDGFNLLAKGLRLDRGDEVLFSNFNHAGASVCWEHFAKERGYVVRHLEIPFADIPKVGTADLVARHVDAIRAKTKVLVLPHIDNMLGLRTPVAAIAKAARQQGVKYVFVDGAQTVGMLPVNVRALGVDGYCTSPHKWLQAPKGIGLMYLAKSVQPDVVPQTVTWGQKRWRGDSRMFEDYGTRDLPAVLALGDAIAFHAKAGIEGTAKRRRSLWEFVRKRVAAAKNIRWRSPERWELGGSLYAIEVVGKKSRDLGAMLWQDHQVVVRAFPDRGLNTLRMSLNVANTEAEIDRFFARLEG